MHAYILAFICMDTFIIQVHTAELDTHEDTADIITFRPDRLGHAVRLDAHAWSSLLSSPIPIEICATSNVKTRAVAAYNTHPFGEWMQRGHPMSLCTDDSGVFNVTLSSEYFVMAREFGLSRAQCVKLSAQAIQYAFAGQEAKEQLSEVFRQRLL